MSLAKHKILWEIKNYRTVHAGKNREKDLNLIFFYKINLLIRGERRKRKDGKRERQEEKEREVKRRRCHPKIYFINFYFINKISCNNKIDYI